MSVPDTVSSVKGYTDFKSLMEATQLKMNKTITIGEHQTQMGLPREVTARYAVAWNCGWD